MAFSFSQNEKNDRFDSEILSVALFGRHITGKIASKKEIELANNYLDHQNYILKSRFKKKSIFKSSPNSIPLGDGMAYGRNIESEKFLHKIKRASSKLSSQNSSLSAKEYTPPQYAIATSQDAAKMRIRDANRRNPIYTNGTGRIESANRLFTDTNFAYNEVEAPPEYAMNLPVTQEQAEKWKREWDFHDKMRKVSGIEHEKYEDARKRYNEYMNPKSEREQLIEEFKGAGKYAEEWADDVLNFRKKSSDDENERLYADRAMKEFPSFFKDTKRSSKDIHDMMKGMKILTKTPFVGRAIRAMAENPETGGLLAAATVMRLQQHAFNISDKTNETVIGWKNAANLYGSPSKKFMETALLAGIKNPAEISKRMGRATMQFGSADIGYKIMASTRDMPPIARMLLAKEFGFDESDVAMADIMFGGIKPDKLRMVHAYKSKIDVQKEYGFSSGSGVGNTTQAIWNMLFGGGKARDAYTFDYVAKGVDEEFYGAIDKMNLIEDAAKNDDYYNENRSSNVDSSTTTTNDNSVAIHVNNLNVKSNNPEELKDALLNATTSDRGYLA